ncbi:MAG TPA: hypothetical protein VF538_02015 [Pyrinomonadaceae bacterium]
MSVWKLLITALYVIIPQLLLVAVVCFLCKALSEQLCLTEGFSARSVGQKFVLLGRILREFMPLSDANNACGEIGIFRCRKWKPT